MPLSQKRQRIAAEWRGDSEQTWLRSLEAPEHHLLRCAKAGDRLDLSESAKDAITPRGPGPLDHEALQRWIAARTIRAAVLRHLLVESAWPVHAKGVRLRGAWITGELDFESATLRCPLVLEDCYVQEPVVLDRATVSQVDLSHCLLAGVSADFLVAGKGLSLRRAVVTGFVQLTGADITSRLSFNGARIMGRDPQGHALVADEVKVGAAVLFGEGFTAAGGVRLIGADITGPLVCQGAHFGADDDGNALSADTIKVGGYVLLDAGFTAAGTVRLSGAHISGPLSCRGADITCRTPGNGHHEPTQTSKTKNYCALSADRATFSSDVLLDRGFMAAGVVRLVGAEITGQLCCSGAQITGCNPDRRTLEADGLTVHGNMLLDDGFMAAGTVRLSGAQIDGYLSLDQARLERPVAFVAEGARIGQQLVWAPASPVTGVVSLERTHVLRLDDDWRQEGACWPTGGRLRLSGFVYDGFGGQYQGSCRQRLEWIRGQHPDPVPGMAGLHGEPGSYDPQPYEQLSRAYQLAGEDGDARTIAVAARSDLRIYGSLNRWQKTWNWLLDKTIRHGYQPLRAVVVLVLLYVLSCGVFWVAQHQHDLIVPTTNTSSLRPAPTSMVCTESYPCFYPAGYAIDVTIPIIKTGQADDWRPNTAVSWGWVTLAGTWVFTGLGWAFTTLAVAGYTGLIRKD